MSAVSGSTVAFLNNRSAANIAKKVTPGANYYIPMIGRNDLSASTTTWLTAMAAHCDTMRAAGFYVAIVSILPATATNFNTWRAVANAEMALWTTGGSTVPGIHCDAFINLDATLMGTDATASNVTYYSDGTHPTALGQSLIEASVRPIIDALTQTGFASAPQLSVPSGTYGSSQSVTLTSATSGASIYYTLDSSDPTTASPLYTGSLTVSATQTIRAIAAKTGLTNSAATDGIYTFGATPATTNGVAWYKFNAGINNATGGVARWEDRWYGRHLMQSTTTKRPAVSSGIITFDGSNDILQKLFTLAQPCTVYALVRQNGWGITKFLWDGGAANAGVWQYSSSPGITGYAGVIGTSDTNATINSWVAICLVLNGASSSLRVNNNAAVTSNCGTNVPAGLTLGGNSGGAQCSNVSFKEVVVYSGAQTTPEQDAEIARLLAI